MNLADKITDYYKEHFYELNPDKQFHFATRLKAWDEDEFSTNFLKTRTDISRYGDLGAIKQDLEDLINNPPSAKINAAQARQQYFDKYPELRGRMLALFRVRHLLTHYDIDARPALLEVCSLEGLCTLSNDLIKDTEALKTLSTYAINYIYLLHFVLFPDLILSEELAKKIYDLGDSYDLDSAEQIQLLIYLYTHCIIGAANFYARPVTKDRDTYTDMLKKLEKVIEHSFGSINLDNKLEFLVCCRIMGYSTNLFERIYAECQTSLSPEGTFVIDTHNSFAQSNKTSFSDSEHRNVLLIMSASTYRHAI